MGPYDRHILITADEITVKRLKALTSRKETTQSALIRSLILKHYNEELAEAERINRTAS